MQTKKRPAPVGKREPGKKQMRQKYFRQTHFNKPKPNIPPQYYRKFDREILEGFAEKFRGSLVGQVAAERLQNLLNQQRGTG